MVDSNSKNNALNLIGSFEIKKTSSKRAYKGEYNRMFPAKMSSSNFLSLYTLFLLSNKSEPIYGKQILQEIQDTIDIDVWKPSHGTLYPLLNDMEKNNLIEVVKETPSKKYYTITKLGKKELDLRLDEFKDMLIQSSNFFNKVISKMYNNLNK
ncbi:PadR family transcriptional regulator [Clostridium felsineum]|uniref:Uncharacterized protein n=1 Tax=Clostridium felsineum TaxID=36839 RepID=A0A1S8MEX7_9CLOT|nr:PadR family transcriptional regulator [Clostridium felsineum]MCR3758689.1 PadR family transcriptional regulator [Clostridium felsineum]URZ09265.1 hypothetical protein CLROS_046810 [Clostridium felsineum]URZ13951.1 hypothetical protein CROST_047290 [Clostridium felsineum]URZ18504.1 hypothetical protein CLFE_045920 [Clostridium felsineum DSM 794]